MTQFYAVLTGDLIASRKHPASEIDRAMTCLAAASSSLPRPDSPRFSHRFTRHRGDGWQMITKHNRALSATLTLSAALRAADIGIETRIAVGIGPITHLGQQDLSDAHGRAFETSGDLLETMPKGRSADRIQIAGPGPLGWQKAVFSLANWIIKGWSAAQAEAVFMTLTSAETTEDHAAKLGISRQAFEARLRGSGLAAMAPARAAFLDWTIHEAAQ